MTMMSPAAVVVVGMSADRRRIRRAAVAATATVLFIYL
jgi:hypothetical protein